jgi:hypothetical protein
MKDRLIRLAMKHVGAGKLYREYIAFLLKMLGEEQIKTFLREVFEIDPDNDEA